MESTALWLTQCERVLLGVSPHRAAKVYRIIQNWNGRDRRCLNGYIRSVFHSCSNLSIKPKLKDVPLKKSWPLVTPKVPDLAGVEHPVDRFVRAHTEACDRLVLSSLIQVGPAGFKGGAGLWL